MITPAEFEDRMQFIKRNCDPEGGHAMADDLMCAVLRDLGYTKGVEIFEQLDKWYS